MSSADSPARAVSLAWAAALPCLFHSGIQTISLAQSPHTAFEMAQRLVSVSAANLAWLPALADRRWYSRHRVLLFAIARLVRDGGWVYGGGLWLPGDWLRQLRGVHRVGGRAGGPAGRAGVSDRPAQTCACPGPSPKHALRWSGRCR